MSDDTSVPPPVALIPNPIDHVVALIIGFVIGWVLVAAFPIILLLGVEFAPTLGLLLLTWAVAYFAYCALHKLGLDKNKWMALWSESWPYLVVIAGIGVPISILVLLAIFFGHH